MTRFVERLRSLAVRLGNAAQALILAGVLVTIADIALRSVSSAGVPGTVDLMQLAVMWSALLAIPAAFLNEEHVAVDLFTKSLPESVQRILRLLGLLLATGALALIVWYGAQQAWREHQGGDSTQTLGFPFSIYWLPLLAGMALSSIACLAMAAETVSLLLGAGRGATTKA
ncbi:MAG: TRAP transporter small permease [Rhodospirillaceae bacterium]|nr:TRAP transporter small permease [Rhodospirillaceae bacterium]